MSNKEIYKKLKVYKKLEAILKQFCLSCEVGYDEDIGEVCVPPEEEEMNCYIEEIIELFYAVEEPLAEEYNDSDEHDEYLDLKKESKTESITFEGFLKELGIDPDNLVFKAEDRKQSSSNP